MVSPSKNLRTSRSEINTGVVPSKTDPVKHRVHRRNSALSSASNLHKPLLNKKFYLDIKSRAEAKRLGSHLQELGAIVEVFLTRDVHIVISDHTGWTGHGLYSPAASISPLTTPSPGPDPKRAIPKSRASAMLDKVSVTASYSNRRSISPLELARLWQKPVWTVEEAQRLLSRAKHATKGAHQVKHKTREETIYIKIESTLGLNKPELLELEAWPEVNLSGYLGQCPFRSPSPSRRSSRSRSRSRSRELDNVRNERTRTTPTRRTLVAIRRHKRECRYTMTRRVLNKCATSYDDDHISPTKLTAQSLCNGHVTRQSSQELLKVQCNGLSTSPSRHSSKLLSPSGSDVLPLPTLRRATRRASASWCGSTRELAQLSPEIHSPPLNHFPQLSPSSNSDLETLSPTGITLRPKGQLWLPVALIGTTAEENGNSIRRRLEPTTKLGSELDGSRHARRQGAPEGETNGIDSDTEMRPRKKRSFSVCAASVHGTTKQRQRTSSVTGGAKKKLSHEEKFLQDNRDYFKMEVLNTKLRSSSVTTHHHHNTATINNVIAKPIEKIIIKKIKMKGRGKRKRSKWAKKKPGYSAIIVDKVKPQPQVNGTDLAVPKKKRQSQLTKLCDEAESFMFGECSRSTADGEDEKRVDLKEENSLDSSRGSWEECSARRKKRRSHAEAFIHDNLDYYKFETPGSRLRYHGDTRPEPASSCQLTDVLYSFETIPAREPWFQVYKRQDEGLERFYPCMSDPADQPFLLPYELPRPLPDPAAMSEYYKRRRKRLALLSNLPRKSPRCHASTLAILSSLKKRKRRSTTSLSTVAELAKPEPEPAPQEEPVHEVVDVLEQLAAEVGDLEDEELVLDGEAEALERNRGLTMDVVWWMETAKDCRSLDDPEQDRLDTDVDSVPDSDAKRRRKKPRKINRTGWDKRVRKKLVLTKGVVTRKESANEKMLAEASAAVVVPTGSRSASADSSSREYAPCIVRVRKMKIPLTSSVTLRTTVAPANTDGGARVGARRTALRRRRRRKVSDYSWSSQKR